MNADGNVENAPPNESRIVRTPMSDHRNLVYEFGRFELIPSEYRLRCDGQPIPLDKRPFDLLVVFAARPGQLLKYDELLDLVWGPNSEVYRNALQVAKAVLHSILGEGYIETVSRCGYRFIMPVTRREEACKLPALEPLAPQTTFSAHPVSALAPEEPTTPPEFPKMLTEARPRKTRSIVSIQTKLVAAILAILLLVAAILTILVPHGIWVFSSIQPRPTGTVAVLPFTVSGKNVEDEDLGMATSDTIITKLGLAGIPVRPLSAAQRYTDTRDDPQTFGRKLGADVVAYGLIQHENDSIRVVVHLVKANDGAQLWTDNFDAKRKEIFTVQDVISRKIAEVIGLKLTDRQNKLLVSHSTENDEAYLAYERGRYLWNKRTLPAFEKAEQYFQQAIALDPGYALAYSGLADVYSMRALYGGGAPQVLFPMARKAARKALELDENSAEAHASLGLIYLYYEWDGAAAEAEFKQSLEINPNYSHVRMWRGINLTAMDRLPEAVKEMERAQELDPLSPIITSASGMPLCFQGEYSRAIEKFKNGLQLDQSFARAEFYLGIAYEQQGLHKQAVTELEKAIRFSDGNPEYQGLLAHAYAMAGDAVQARRILDKLKQRSTKEYVPAFSIALVYQALGERDRAFEWLDKAYEDRSGGMVYLRVDPLLNELRSDPRFKRLSEQIKFR